MSRHADALKRSTDRAHADTELLELVRCVAQATLEYVFDDYGAPESIWTQRHQIAREVRDFVAKHEVEDPDSELAKVRRRIR